jgi:ribosomal protein S18 acetylase RimI-like enzyme
MIEISDIRQASLSDVPKIIPLWKELFHFHEHMDRSFEVVPDAEEKFIPFLKSVIELQDENKAVVFVAESPSDNKIIGYILGMTGKNPPIFTIQDYGYITDMCVTRGSRQQGVGKKLVEEVKNWFYSQGINRIQLHAASDNPVSLAFWKKMGFKTYMVKMSWEHI